ncbi:MAG: hypothetical protein ACC619_09920 [Paracoccaceae bacterium]
MSRLKRLLMLIPAALAAQSLVVAAGEDGAPRSEPYDYFCTGSNGERYELGEVICIRSSSCQPVWLAKCDMSLNNPMWRKVQDGCPVAGVSAPPQRSLLARIHALQPLGNS